MVLPLLRLGPKVSQRDVAIALEEIERYLNKMREQLSVEPPVEEPSGPTTVEWGSIVGVPDAFNPIAHIHADSLGVIQHGGNATATRPAGYAVVLWIGTVPPLGEEEGGSAKNDDLLLLLNFM